MIWQVPAWGSAVFALAITSAVLMLANSASIQSNTSIPVSSFVGIFLVSVFLIILALTNVFLRFRLHQRTVHRPNSVWVPTAWFMFPGQTTLLFVLLLEAAVVLCFALLVFGVQGTASYLIAGIFMLAAFGYIEYETRKIAKVLREDRSKGQENR